MTSPLSYDRLRELAGRVEAADGPDRELDADIAEQVYGWRAFRVGPDYDGQNACEVLTETGAAYPGFVYPPRGALPRWYHVPPYTRNCRERALPRDSVRVALATTLRALSGTDTGEKVGG